jgi:hypothetical protein
MKNIVKLISIGFMVIVAVSCEKEPPAVSVEQTDFMNQTAYGVYTSEGAVFTYSEESCQLYYSPTKHSARILKDDLSAYVTVTFSDEIVANATVEGSVSLNGFTASSFLDYPLNVLKLEDGKAWVWYDRSKVGYLIPWNI